jgi:ribosomal protein S16
MEVIVMPTLTLTDGQVIELVGQMSPEQQEELFKLLLMKHWGAWVDLSRYGEESVRQAAAQRGRDRFFPIS